MSKNILFTGLETQENQPKWTENSVDQIKIILNRIFDSWLTKINDCRNDKNFQLRLGSFYLMVISDMTLTLALFGEILLRSGHITHFIVPLSVVTLLMFLLIIVIKVCFYCSEQVLNTVLDLFCKITTRFTSLASGPNRNCCQFSGI